MATPFEVLLTGDVVAAAIQVFTDAMGPWFYAFGISALLIMIYFKSKSISIISVMGLISTVALTNSGLLPAEAVGVIYIILAMSIAGILYSAFGPKGG